MRPTMHSQWLDAVDAATRHCSRAFGFSALGLLCACSANNGSGALPTDVVVPDVGFATEVFALSEPTLTILAPANMWSYKLAGTNPVPAQVKFAVSGFDLGIGAGGVSCRLDGANPFVVTASPANYPNLGGLGMHSLSCVLVGSDGVALPNPNARFVRFVQVTQDPFDPEATCASNASCSDGNVCSQDDCSAAKCAFAHIDGCCNNDWDCAGGETCVEGKCSVCKTAADCDDGDACTGNVCDLSGVRGVCAFPKTDPNCCSTAADPCSDGLACTQDSCNVATGKCQHLLIPGACCADADCATDDPCVLSGCNGKTCVSTADPSRPDCCSPATNPSCTDQDPCTVDACNAAQPGGWTKCSHATDASKTGCCVSDAECNDGLLCTADACVANLCVHAAIAGCCTGAANGQAECDDKDPCTIDSCANHACQHAATAVGCCDSDADCDDGDGCSTDSCAGLAKAATGLCTHGLLAGCECTAAYGAEECDDQDACTQDTCVGSVCQHTKTGPCCLKAADCDDGQPCTEDFCVKNQCSHTSLIGTGCCTTATQETDCAYLSTICAKGVCKAQTDGTLHCATEPFTTCIAALDYCEDFSGPADLPGLGWTPTNLKATASGNWARTTGGPLGPDGHARMNWTPVTYDYDTCLVSPIFQAAGAKTITVQWDREFVYAYPGTQLRVLGALGGAEVNWSAATVLAQDTPTASTGPQLLDLQLPSNLTGNNGLRIAFCASGPSTYNLNTFNVDNVCIARGGKPTFVLAPTNQVLPLGTVKRIPIQAFDPDASAYVTVSMVEGPAFASVTKTAYFWPDGLWHSGLILHPAAPADVGTWPVTLKFSDGALYSLVHFDVTVTYLGGYLVWQPSEVPAASATAIRQALLPKGAVVQIIHDLSLYPDLSPFTAVFATLGVFPKHHVLGAGDAASLGAYLGKNGRLYVEGGDTWFADVQTQLQPKFGIVGMADSLDAGIAPTLHGGVIYLDDATLAGLDFGFGQAYTDNNLNDVLGVVGSPASRGVLRSASGANDWVQVAHDDAAGYRTVGSSVPFSGVTSGPATAQVLIDKIIAFFEKGFPAPCGGVDCSDGNPCTFDSCPSGSCTHAPQAGPCDDGNVCTTSDACNAGVCAGSATLQCNDGNPCTTDSCDPKLGCVTVANSAPCDDGNVCTTVDVCAAGACKPGAALVCNDGNVCTTDACDPIKGCTFTINALACSDGNACTTGDVCAAGACKSGAATVCDDGNPCTTDACNAATGCVVAAINPSSATLSVPSDTSTLANGKAAVATYNGNAGWTATLPGATWIWSDLWVQNPTTDTTVVFQRTFAVPVLATNLQGTLTIAADNSYACTLNGVAVGQDATEFNYTAAGQDTWPLTAALQPGDNVLVCTVKNWGKAGTTAMSNPAGLLYHVDATYTAWTGCNDGNACTAIDVCSAGACKPGAALACNDGNPCTTDTCDPQKGCTFTNNTLACSDGIACTIGDACSAGACKGGPVCDDGNPCTDGTCDAVKGCVYANNLGVCSDGNAATVGDFCSSGTCRPGFAPRCLSSWAILTTGDIKLSSTTTIDSFDSGNPAYSTGGMYDATKRHDRAWFGALLGTAKIAMNDSKTYGYVANAAGANVSVGSLGGVGDATWLATHTGSIEAGHQAAAPAISLPNVVLPFAGGMTPTFGKVDGITYSYVLGDGDYKMASLTVSGGMSLAVVGDARLYVVGDTTVSGSGFIVVKGGGRLQLFAGGKTTISGSGVANLAGTASHFQIYGLPTCTNISFTGSASCLGVIYAPQAAITLSNTGGTIGSLIGATFQANAGVNVHFDEALGSPDNCVGPGAICVAGSCNDGNLCTADTCSTTAGCVHTATVCNDSNPCTADSCNIATGACVFADTNEGGTCGTGQSCLSGSCGVCKTYEVTVPVADTGELRGVAVLGTGVLMAGWKMGAGKDAWLAALDASGSVLWQKTLGGAQDDVFYDLKASHDGTYYAAGTTSSSGMGLGDGWLVHLDASGNTLWQSVLGNAQHDEFRGVIALSDGGALAVGTQSDTIDHAWCVRYDATGKVTWKLSNNSVTPDFWSAGVQQVDGSFVLVGGRSFASGTMLDPWRATVSGAGALTTSMAYAQAGDNQFNDAVLLADGSVVAVGFNRTSDLASSGTIARLNAAGAAVWQKTLTGVSVDQLSGVAVLKNGDVVAAGGAGFKDKPACWFVRADQGGNIVWQQNACAEKLGAAYHVVTTPDGTFAAAGWAKNAGWVYRANGLGTTTCGN